MRLGLVAVAAAGLVLGLSDRAAAQVIYYNTPVYYTSPYTPFVRTYSTPVMYSTYTSPIVVPTRFTYPAWGTVGYDYPPAAAGQVNALNSTAAGSTGSSGSSGSGSSTATSSSTNSAVVRAGYVQPYPAFRQVGFSTYTNAALPIGGAYYSGDAYIPPSAYGYTPYPEHGYAPYGYGPPMSYGAFATPYYQIQFGEGYGGWGMGRGWGGWGRGWGWGW